MRSLLALVVAACSGPANQPGADASDAVDVASPIDAAPPCGASLPFQASEAYDVVSDGTTLFISIRATDGTMQIITLPFAGGTPTPLVTGAEEFQLAWFDDTIFYNVHAGASYELHQRVAGADTVLANVPANGEIDLAATATDLYVLGRETLNKVTLWRIPRGGAGSGPLPTVISMTGTNAARLALGATLATFYIDGTIQMVTIPGPSTATEVQNTGSCCYFIGDIGYWFAAGMLTQNTKWSQIQEFTPVNKVIYSGMYYMDFFGPMFTDEKYIYLGHGTGNQYMNADGASLGGVCSSSRGAQDSTHLFGLQNTYNTSDWYLQISAKAP